MVSPSLSSLISFPNTEKWYTKWKDLLFQMLFFFPMFGFLFGASKLAGWAIMTTAGTSPFRILLGLAVQVMPLFLTISLLKMSGTILGKISAGLDRLSNPIRTTATMWGASHAIQAEKRFLKRNSFLGGARLRNYLLARQKRRELDTINNQNTIEGRATERALRSITSFKGYDKDGNAIWRNRPNAYTRNAKASALQTTRAEVAKRNLDNTLSEYGDIFTGQAAHRLSNAHAESYLAVMAQQFRAEKHRPGRSVIPLESLRRKLPKGALHHPMTSTVLSVAPPVKWDTLVKLLSWVKLLSAVPKLNVDVKLKPKSSLQNSVTQSATFVA